MSLLHPGPAALAPARQMDPRPEPWPARDPRDTRPAAPPLVPAARDPAGFAVDRLDAVDAAAHRDAWLALVGRSLEPNAFLDPDFVLPAAQHLAGRRRPCFVLVWAVEGGERRDLVALCPVLGRRGPLRGLASAWMHDLSTLGFPLLDRARAEAALSALLHWAGDNLRGAAGLILPSLPAEGPTAAVLRRVAASDGLDIAVVAAWERAALRPRGHAGGPPGAPAGLGALSAKGAKELRRQRRRLGERGTLRFCSTTADGPLRGEVERFLCLEAGGWKGAAGTAMLSSPGRTAFLRTITRLLVRRGLCRIDSLTLDGAPVAMAVVLSAGEADFLWKIAHREDVARSSPGVQLVLHLTESALGSGGAGRPGIVDSCAVPDHPMIDRLWRDRIGLVDVAVSTRRRGRGEFRRAVALERAARRLRAEAKRVVLAWRARRGARRAAGAAP